MDGLFIGHRLGSTDNFFLLLNIIFEVLFTCLVLTVRDCVKDYSVHSLGQCTICTGHMHYIYFAN
jgi:hypothetical protein